MLRDVPVPDAAPAVVDHDEHVERAEGEGLHREQVSSPDAGRVVAQKRAPRLTRRSPERLLTVAAHGAERSPRSQAHAAHQRCARRPTVDSQWRCAGSAAATRRECGDAQVRDDSSSASRRTTTPQAGQLPRRRFLVSRTILAAPPRFDRGATVATIPLRGGTRPHRQPVVASVQPSSGARSPGHRSRRSSNTRRVPLRSPSGAPSLS